MRKSFFISNIEDLNVVAKDILLFIYPNKKIAFYGNLGVGKTTLIKALSLQLGVSDLVQSPTFSIVNEYKIELSNDKIFHFDFYRIKDEKEVYDIGYEDYFYSDNYCFIEWPEKIMNLINEEVVKIKICLVDNIRKIEVII